MFDIKFLRSSSSDFDFKACSYKTSHSQYVVWCCESVRQEHYNLFQELSSICPQGTISHCWNLPGSFLCCLQHASHESLGGSKKLPKNCEREKSWKGTYIELLLILTFASDHYIQMTCIMWNTILVLEKRSRFWQFGSRTNKGLCVRAI